MRILVLGAGRMGLGATYDLSRSGEVDAITVADLSLDNAARVAASVNSSKVLTVAVDVLDYPQVVALMSSHDAAISCVVYKHNLLLARAAIEAGTNFCDLGGNHQIVEAELALDEQARRVGINLIPDCGLAPGMVSVLAAHGAARFESLDSIHIRVGGLPQRPSGPLKYQIVFSVEGLLNEYAEPARVIRAGRITEVESLTDLELLEFPPFGTVEAFQTSGGISTLPESFLGRVRELDYKTIRYLGHCEQFRLLVELGLTRDEPLPVAGMAVAPRALLAELLLQRLPTEGPDVVLVHVEFRGIAGGKQQTLTYRLIDYYDEGTGLSAMTRTTAFPASIIAQMMCRGDIREKGAIPQERCVPPDLFIAALADRGIHLSEQQSASS
jgi:lysine 6-dehydrogenase